MLFWCLMGPSLYGLSSRFLRCLCLLMSPIFHGFLSVLLSVLLSSFVAHVAQDASVRCLNGLPLSEDNIEELLTLLASFSLNRPSPSHLNCLINLFHQIDCIL